MRSARGAALLLLLPLRATALIVPPAPFCRRTVGDNPHPRVHGSDFGPFLLRRCEH